MDLLAPVQNRTSFPPCPPGANQPSRLTPPALRLSEGLEPNEGTDVERTRSLSCMAMRCNV
jgi:hypothetical protein